MTKLRAVFPCFNSSVVRLVVRYFTPIRPFTSFQFQCGAIGRNATVIGGITWYKFQFQCGAIGSPKADAKEMIKLSFNSSVVRLVAVRSKNWHRYSLVSIPVWCDW